MIRKITSAFIGLLVYSTTLVNGQSSCSYWQQRDSTFSYVQFQGASPPYYSNDDASSNAIQLPFTFCYWGNAIDSLWINTNGNISFQGGLSSFSSDTFPRHNHQMIAPFWADVYTVGGPPGSDVVIYKMNPHSLIIQWDSVSYFATYNSNKTNSFQLIISDGTDPIIPAGNNVEFSYKQMQWTTGTASGGTNAGFHGDPANVGANEGDGVRSIQLGLFDSPNANYFGQFPPPGSNSDYDGVYWLDNRTFVFNLCAGTVAPLLSSVGSSGSSACDTVIVCEGDSTVKTKVYLAPLQGDSVWSNLVFPTVAGVSVAGSYPGPTDSIHIKMVGSAANVGSHTINFYGYDNQVPADTTFSSLVLEVLQAPQVHFIAVDDTLCKGGDTATLSATGGVSYIWSTGETTTTIKVHPLVPTTYSIVVTGASTCSRDTSIEVYINPVPTASASIIDSVVCPHGSSTISVTSSPNFTYKWNTGATTSSITVTDTISTTYTATIYAKCDSLKLTKKVTVVTVPKPIISGSLTECMGIKDVLTASGAATYLWSNGGTTDKYFTGDINGDSTITVTGYNSIGQISCPANTTYTVSVKNAAVVSINPTGIACKGSKVMLQANVSGTGPFSYKWSPGGGSTLSITVDDSTVTYTLTVNNGCLATATTNVTADNPIMSACCDGTIHPGGDTLIVAAGSAIKHYQWSPGTGICDSCPAITVSPKVTTTYTVIGTDTMGCQITRMVTITVETPCANFVVPNVFTPNFKGVSGHDNVLYINTLNVDSWSISIFDRWGKAVYTSTDVTQYWTGTTESGAEAQDGTYYYIISAGCQGSTYKKEGFIQLIR